MKILVIGGTGKVGQHLVEKLVDRGANVRVLTRSAERAAKLSRAVEPVVANITQDPFDAQRAFEGVSSVFMLNQPTSEEMVEGQLGVALAKAMGVQHFVYQSVHAAEKMDYIPHVASKLAIERAVRASGMAWTFLRPNYFYQNDINAKAGLVEGLFTQPIGGAGVASVDADDIAEISANALLEEGHMGKSYNLVGPDVLTGETCARIWSEVTGREILYVGDPDRWQAATRPFMPAWFNYDLAMMYRHLCNYGMPPEANDAAKMTTLLGHPPRSYRDYVTEQAAAWRMTKA